MPVSFAIELGDDPRRALRDFMVAFRAFLDEVTASDLIGPRLPEPGLLELLRAAWNATRPQVEDVRKALADRDLVTDAALEARGLSGAPLRFKLAAIRAVNEPFERSGSYFAVGTTGLLRRLFEILDALLESILSLLPGPTGKGLEEIKKFIERLIT